MRIFFVIFTLRVAWKRWIRKGALSCILCRVCDLGEINHLRYLVCNMLRYPSSHFSSDEYFYFITLLPFSFMMCANNRIHYGPMVAFVCLPSTLLHYHNYAVWKYWTSNILVRYILWNVCIRLCQLSQLPFMQYMRLCVLSLPISLVMIVRIFGTLSYHHLEIRSVNHLPLFRVRSWNNGMLCMFFCIPIIVI